jgi:DNA replication protein DnaC
VDNNNASDSKLALGTTLNRLIERARNTPPIPAEESAKREAAKAAEQSAVIVQKLAAQLGARYSPDRVTLDTFELYDPKQRLALNRARDCASRIATLIRDGRNLVFYGVVGTGKDHLMIALLYEAARLGADCRWVNGQEIYGQFRDRIDSGQREEELLNALVKPHVLAISDPIPPVGGPTSWNVQQLYRLLDRRYRALKSTWISMNALSLEDADEKLSAPVFDRIRQDAELFPCFWPSYRERSQKRAG